MFYDDGEKIELLDSVVVDTGARGSVIGFDRVNGRQFVMVRTAAGSKVWATANAVKKFRKLIVQSEV